MTMELHKNWSVSKLGLDRLRELTPTALKEVIKNKNLFGGMPTAYAEKQNALIYGKVNPKGTNTKARKANTSKVKKGDGKDNPKGQADN